MSVTPAQQSATPDQAREMGLLPEEFEMIKVILGRTPNFTEMCIYSVIWSEPCSHKNSLKWLSKLPKEGAQVLATVSDGNAGIIDIGDGAACAFKMASYNHAGAKETSQRAAAGVGGINRDIFAMGARPIAQMSSLCFGNLKNEKTKSLMSGIVKEIGDCGNSLGIATVDGATFFDDSYEHNPLVSVLAIGLVENNNVITSKANGSGNPVYIIGASTGKDGIKRESFATGDMTNESDEDLQDIRVANPHLGKLLLEATMELAGTDAIIGMHGIGAGGLAFSTSLMNAGGNVGMDIYLDRVPLSYDGMQPFEILLSESQERMLIVIKKGEERNAERIFDKWDVGADQIGVVTEGPDIRYFMKGEIVGEVPASGLLSGGGAPLYDRKFEEPGYFKESGKFKIEDVAEPKDLVVVARQLIAHPNISSKKWIFEQYDSMVGTANMTTNKPSDASVINIKGTNKALALTIGCNSRYVHNDPETGTMIAVAEAARNIVCSGGEPAAISNCMNFGNPYNAEVYWQFVGAVKGMSKASIKFNTPVTSDNVNFYNQTSLANGQAEAILPTPAIGMLGLLRDKSLHTTLDFKYKGDLIYLLGEPRNDINSSQYLELIHGVKLSPVPHFDMEEEFKLLECCKGMIRNNFISAAHNVSDGGLFVTLVEMALPNGLGFDIVTDGEIRRDAFLFGESQSRIAVTVVEDYEEEFLDFVTEAGVNVMLLGHVTKGRLTIDEENFGAIEDMRALYENSIADEMNR